MGILDQIANPQLANIPQALDIRQKRIEDQQKALARIEMGREIAKALPNLQQGTGFHTLATNDPEKFALTAKVLGIPLNDGERFNQFTSDVNQLYTLAQSGDGSAYQHAQQLIAQRKEQGQDTKKLEEWVGAMDADPQQAMTSLFVMHRAIDQLSVKNQTAGQKEFNSMTEGLSKNDIEKAKRISLGLDPRAVGSGAITTATQGLTDQVAASQGTIEGVKASSKETAKLDVQLEKLPQLKSAVKDAEMRIKELGDKRTAQAQNAIVMDMYQTGMSGLTSGLEGTSTGPVVGRMPAVTTGQQIAEGSIAAMAPLLKSLFRNSGEGTFTDKDQELLMNMLPTRKDTPEARSSKISNIDSIVKAKLNQGGSGQGAMTTGITGSTQTGEPSIEDLLGKY